MKIHIEDKAKLVNRVFSEVYKKYDFMNDVMSLGIHRIWKKNMIDWMRPQKDTSLLDVASGTGDLAKKFLERTNNNCNIVCVEPNKDMLKIGEKKLRDYKNVKWKLASAEKLPFKDNTFDFYTISYGIRNVSNINLTLKEALRVLKPGGRFMCLEFSKIENELLNQLYKQYSKTIPLIGKLIVGNSMPYEYLINSIDKFHSQKKLAKLMKKSGFSNIEYRNLSSGISALHSGWKI
ncbi:bifunctional demethylmenaquinone methyltransferase/2-methoxy-6-polyprenyl-1,4-benzoquinol methylase UbiE [Pelagibacteraceae bacterium]|nr:bifunctional demethylmenaquinone methyltransferase/2-methoxy-6-polyprenyl-1,4-benzoquinol methylase UbiE [Pelagibacteraceae bacterium]